MILIEMRENSIGKLFLDEVEGKKLFVWIPKNADISKEKLPVIYSFDAQMLFEQHQIPFKTLGEKRYWNIDHVVQRLIDERKITNTMVVGLFNAGEERAKEYIPYIFEEGKNFAKFIVEKVIPYIESSYHARSDKSGRAIIGSSLGGLMAMYMANNYDEYFDTVCALSIHDPWLECDIDRHIKKEIKFWIDVGTSEYRNCNKDIKFYEQLAGGQIDLKMSEIYSYTETARNIIEKLLAKGYELGKDIFYYEDIGGRHFEEDWERRIYYGLMVFAGTEIGTIKEMDVQIEAIKTKQNQTQYLINSLGTFESGMKYTLFNDIEYITERNVTITHHGILEMNGEKKAKIKLKYKEIEKNLEVEQYVLEKLANEIKYVP